MASALPHFVTDPMSKLDIGGGERLAAGALPAPWEGASAQATSLRCLHVDVAVPAPAVLAFGAFFRDGLPHLAGLV